MAVTRARNSGIKTGVLKYDSMLGGYPPLMAAPTATAGVESASVAFTAVSGISTYRVISTPGSLTGTGSASPISVTGLTAGTGYTFQVRGENTVGNGAYSAASNSVTPTPNTSYESIATATPSGTGTVTFSSISSAYKHLQIRMITRTNVVTTGFNLSVRFNNNSTQTYDDHTLFGNGSTATAEGSINRDSFRAFNSATGSSIAANIFGVAIIDIHDYASTTKNKTVRVFSGADWNAASTDARVYLSSAQWRNTAAINRIDILVNVGADTFVSGSSIALYGIKG